LKGLPNDERQRLGALLDQTSQDAVMAQIPQFSEAEVHNMIPPASFSPDQLRFLVFNMERGVHLVELGDFL